MGSAANCSITVVARATRTISNLLRNAAAFVSESKVIRSTYDFCGAEKVPRSAMLFSLKAILRQFGDNVVEPQFVAQMTQAGWGCISFFNATAKKFQNKKL